MRIALDVSQMVYEGTGVSSYTKNLVKHLLTLNSGHNFTLYAGTLRNTQAIKNYMTTSPYNRAEWATSPLSPRLASLAFNSGFLSIDLFIKNIDIFHASDWTHPKSSSPSLTTVHDLVFIKYPETHDPLIIDTQKKRMEMAVKHSSHFICDSMSTKNDLMKEHGISAKKITVVYLGIDDSFTQATNNEIERVKSKYKIEGDYILSLGKKEPRKNIARTVEAFIEYRKYSKKDTSLVIAGSEGWGDKISTKETHIQEIGFVDQNDLPALYSGAEMLVYPSLYEGFGFPVLEAMSCGTPVVTSNVSSLPELAGDAGVLVDPTSVKSIVSGMKKAHDNKGDLSQKGIKQAAKFTWQKTAKETLKVYEKVYNEGKSQA